MGGTGSNSEDNITDFPNDNYGLSMKYIPYKGGVLSLRMLLVNKSIHRYNPSEALGFYNR